MAHQSEKQFSPFECGRQPGGAPELQQPASGPRAPGLFNENEANFFYNHGVACDCICSWCFHFEGRAC